MAEALDLDLTLGRITENSDAVGRIGCEMDCPTLAVFAPASAPAPKDPFLTGVSGILGFFSTVLPRLALPKSNPKAVGHMLLGLGPSNGVLSGGCDEDERSSPHEDARFSSPGRTGLMVEGTRMLVPWGLDTLDWKPPGILSCWKPIPESLALNFRVTSCPS
jgi:hypothetical protein